MKKVNQKVENEFWNKTVREIHYKIRPKFSDDIYYNKFLGPSRRYSVGTINSEITSKIKDKKW